MPPPFAASQTFSLHKFKIPSRLRFAHTAEIIFDPSIFDLFVCWLNAGTVVPVNKKEYKVNFINYFKKNKKINVCFLVPSHFQKLKDLNNLKSKYLKNLKHVIFTGEYLSKSLGEKQSATLSPVSESVVNLDLSSASERCHIPMMIAPHSHSVWWSREGH